MTDEVISTDIIPSEEIEHEIEEIETSSQEDQKGLGISEAKRFKLDLGENLEHLPLSSGTMQRPISKLTTGPRPSVYDLQRKQMLEIVESQSHRITYRTMLNPIDGDFTIGRVYIDNKPTTFLSCDHPKCVGTSSRYLKAFFNISNTPHKNSFRKHHNRRHCEGGARQIFATFDDLAEPSGSQTGSATPEPVCISSSASNGAFVIEIEPKSENNLETEYSSDSPIPPFPTNRRPQDESQNNGQGEEGTDWKKSALEWKRRYEVLEGKYSRTQEELHDLRRLVEGFYLNTLQLKQKNPNFK